MPHGLQIWDGNGAIILDTNYMVGRVLGKINVTADGSLFDARLSKGRPFYFTQVTYQPTWDFDAPGRILVGFSGNVISWTLSKVISTSVVSGAIFYGLM